MFGLMNEFKNQELDLANKIKKINFEQVTKKNVFPSIDLNDSARMSNNSSIL